MKLEELASSTKTIAIPMLGGDIELATQIQTQLGKMGLLDPPEDGRFGPVSHWALAQVLTKMKAPNRGVVDLAIAEVLLAGEKRLVVIESRRRSFVDREVVQARPSERRVVANQVQQQGLVAVPYLPQKQRVEHFRGGDELGECLPLVGRKRSDVGGEIDRSEAHGHRLDLLRFRVSAWLGGLGLGLHGW